MKLWSNPHHSDREGVDLPSLLPKFGFPAEGYALIATAVLAHHRGSQVDRLMAALEAQRWSELLHFRDWEGAQDNVEVYALRSADDQIALVAVLHSFEPFVPTQVLKRERLTPEAGAQFMKTLHPNWSPVPVAEIDCLEVPRTKRARFSQAVPATLAQIRPDLVDPAEVLVLNPSTQTLP